MALPPNVERSPFLRATYVAHDNRGHVWHVARAGRDWRARPAPSNPARALGTTIVGNTLAAVAHALTTRRAAVVVEPF